MTIITKNICDLCNKCVPFILYHIIRGTRAKFGIPNSCQSGDIQQKLDGGISDFWICGQVLIKNCHNSITSDEIDMKLGPSN